MSNLGPRLVQIVGLLCAGIMLCAPSSCTVQTTPYELQVPDHMPAMPLSDENPMTEEDIELGRHLFYSTTLDGVESRACGGCHTQEGSFTSIRPDATGVQTHINIGWSSNFLWDGKVQGTLEDIMFFEVDQFFEADERKLADDETIAELFQAAWGPDAVTRENAADSLAQFLRTLIHANSKYDRYWRGEGELTDAETRGMNLFFTEEGDCFHCHGTLLCTDNSFHNNGLDSEWERQGLGDITGDPQDNGRFRTPTLRNIELTAPYMHDDRFATLEEVIDHYSEGLVFSDTVDSLMKNVHEGGVQLDEDQKADLLAFLKTLTDESVCEDPALSAP
jgi:cytochrome c peroxidase